MADTDILQGHASLLTAEKFHNILRLQLFGLGPRQPDEEYVLTCEDTTCKRVFTNPYPTPYCPDCQIYGAILLQHYAEMEMRWGVRPI